MPKNEAGTTGTLTLMGDLQRAFGKLPSAACRDSYWGKGAVSVCSFCLGMAYHLRQYCARAVYDKKPSAGENDSVLEHKAATTGEIGEAVLCSAESRHPSFRRRHEEGEGDEWCKERQDCSGKSQAHRPKARQHQEPDGHLNSPESV